MTNAPTALLPMCPWWEEAYLVDLWRALGTDGGESGGDTHIYHGLLVVDPLLGTVLAVGLLYGTRLNQVEASVDSRMEGG